MTAENIIDKNFTEVKPYEYAKIWKAHSGLNYNVLNKYQKSFWREAVKDRAEYCLPLLDSSYFLNI